MNMINESLDFQDMKTQINDVVTIDEYSAKMGEDSDIVTITFTVKSKLAADDLVTWFERGYDWVVDASVSDGEIDSGRWLVFVELMRRSTVPSRMMTLLTDLETLTDRKIDEWKLDIEGNDVAPTEEAIANNMILNPNEYRDLRGDDEDEDETMDDSETEEDLPELNEFRELAGIDVKTPVYEQDSYIKHLKSMAGL